LSEKQLGQKKVFLPSDFWNSISQNNSGDRVKIYQQLPEISLEFDRKLFIGSEELIRTESNQPTKYCIFVVTEILK